MASLDPTTLTSDQLTSMLNAWAKGSYGDESAVNLLDAHGTWLARHDFLKACVEVADRGASVGTAPMAWVDWDAAARLGRTAPASASEALILRLACSLAGVEAGTLRELTSGLDTTNTARILDALAHRAGWHERGIRHTVDGYQFGVVGSALSA